MTLSSPNYEPWVIKSDLDLHSTVRETSLTLIGKSWKTHPDIFPKFSFSGSSHRPFYWKTHPIFFWNFNSGASHRPFYWKTHPLKIMSTYSVFFNSGASPRPFYWKTHPFEFWLKPYRICNIWSKCKSCRDIVSISQSCELRYHSLAQQNFCDIAQYCKKGVIFGRFLQYWQYRKNLCCANDYNLCWKHRWWWHLDDKMEDVGDKIQNCHQILRLKRPTFLIMMKSSKRP